MANEEKAQVKDYQKLIDEIFGKGPWYEELYYSVYRFFDRIGSPRDWYYGVKHFYQRGKRGWADCDTWSLDWYLAGWIPNALRYLKAHKHGTPMQMFYDEDLCEDGNVSAEGSERGQARWNTIIDKMIEGFEAAHRLNIGYYSDLKGLNGPERAAKSKELEAQDMATFEEGMKLFTEHFHSLWD